MNYVAEDTMNTATQASCEPLIPASILSGVAYREPILNGLVYELCFPEEVQGAGLHLFDLIEQARLRDIEKIPEPDRLPRLRAKFEELYDGGHPLRIALDKLQTLDTIRIIEGKALAR